MDVYVVRHGQSTANAKKIFAGWAQVPLTEKGVEQARSTRPLLENIKFTKVIASDLQRAIQTAQEVLPGYEITTDARLREIHVGSMEGKTYAEAGAEFLQKRDYTPYGGENGRDHFERVARFMESIEREPKDAIIAVVCHEGTINRMLSYILKYSVPRNAAPVSNGAVCAFSYRDGVWSLKKWNENGTALISE